MSKIPYSKVTKSNLPSCQQHLTKVTSDPSFLSNEGLNNEVPFHICPYDPSIQSEMTQLVRQLRNELHDRAVVALEVNLYDLIKHLLERDGDWDWLIDNEQSLSKVELKEELQGILDVETVITPAILELLHDTYHDLLIITGVGEVYPYIRSHNILNNLQKVAKDKPTLMFFPGEYQHSLESGAALILFGCLQDDKYYRAFNILDRAI